MLREKELKPGESREPKPGEPYVGYFTGESNMVEYKSRIELKIFCEVEIILLFIGLFCTALISLTGDKSFVRGWAVMSAFVAFFALLSTSFVYLDNSEITEDETVCFHYVPYMLFLIVMLILIFWTSF